MSDSEDSDYDQAEGYYSDYVEHPDYIARHQQPQEERNDVVNIRREMEEIMTSRTLNWNFAFSFRQTYADAPNPVLKIDGIGTVGLPLSDRDAEAIKSQTARTASKRHGRRSSAAKVAQDTWEIAAGKVTFASPRWDAFLEKAAEEICRTFNITSKVSQPRCEFLKLLLNEPGESCLPDITPDLPEGAFAVMLVVLPSEYTDGMVDVSHASLSFSFPGSSASADQTTVVAWHASAAARLHPLTSGTRIALCYALTLSDSSPSAPTPDPKLTTRLTKVLSAWQAAPRRMVPQKLLVLLGETYSDLSAGLGALRGADAQKAAVLSALGAAHGFGVGLADVRVRLSGPTEDDFGRKLKKRGGRIDFEVDDVRVDIGPLADLEGQVLAEEIAWDEHRDEENVPRVLAGEIGDGPCEKEKYDRDAAFITRWFRRTLLVIWPERSRHSLRYTGSDGFDRAFDELGSSRSKKPTEDERALVSVLLDHREGNTKDSAHLCCQLACRWKDAELWQEVIATFAAEHGLDVVPDEVKFEAAKVFGFSKVKDAFESMLSADKRNAARLEFLAAVDHWMRTRPPAARKKTAKEVQPWLETETQAVLGSLRKPSEDECAALVAAARANGGVGFLQEHMLPQLLKVGDGDFLLAFAEEVHAEASFADPPKRNAVHALLQAAVDKTAWSRPPGPVRIYIDCSWPRKPQPKEVDYTERAQSFAGACATLGHSDVAGRVFRGVARVPDDGRWTQRDRWEYAKKVMLPLVTFMFGVEKECEGYQRPEEFYELRAKTVKLCLSYMRSNEYGVSMQGITEVMDAAVTYDGDSRVFFTEILPTLEPKVVWHGGNLRTMIAEVRRVRKRITYPKNHKGRTVEQLLYALGEEYIKTAWLPGAEEIMETLTWARGIHRSLAQQVLDRVFGNPEALELERIAHVLAPLVPRLRAWQEKNGMPDTLVEPVRKMVSAWADKVFAASPPGTDSIVSAGIESLRKWTCKCKHCASARAFLQQSLDRRMQCNDIDRGYVPTHLEGELEKYAKKIAKWRRYNPGGPLVLEKTDGMHKYSAWRAARIHGPQMLRDISDDEKDLRQILGKDLHVRIAKLLAVEPRPIAQTMQSTSAPPPVQAPIGRASISAIVRRRSHPGGDAVVPPPPLKKRKV